MVESALCLQSQLYQHGAPRSRRCKVFFLPGDSDSSAFFKGKVSTEAGSTVITSILSMVEAVRACQRERRLQLELDMPEGATRHKAQGSTHLPSDLRSYRQNLTRVATLLYLPWYSFAKVRHTS